ncbi:MAG: hypothetical protein M8364_17520 [Methylobacter sp.]|uniref:hypothetical protein n=1 Tax=Methylobacter sp. TaxID=2051955 RepID=UPI00258C0393|nr:hypothetical protein [Methylobacter sp.]MCL7422692.1 hypothetical protein [Methylobacter sp.]
MKRFVKLDVSKIADDMHKIKARRNLTGSADKNGLHKSTILLSKLVDAVGYFESQA